MKYTREQIEKVAQWNDEHMYQFDTSDMLRQLLAENDALAQQVAHFGSALSDIASGEILRSYCYGPHCDEEMGAATAEEMQSRADGALHWYDLLDAARKPV